MTLSSLTTPLASKHASGRLSIQGLSKRYTDHQAVAGVDLEIEPGELVAFLGPSGCGKTTILRCVAGLIQPSQGDIRIDGQSILSTPIYKRELGMVFQSYALFPHLSVAQNVAFGLRMHGIKGSEASARVGEALALVDLTAMAGRMPSQLSGGQQQRVALARAIATQPRVLLLDEPFSALDAKLRESVQIELRDLVKRLGITTILVTHDQAEAMVTADRIAVLNAGRLEQFDTPEAVYNTPHSLFTANFVGQTNRIPGKLVRRDGTLGVVRVDADGSEVCVRDNESINIGDNVDAVVRPENIDFSAHLSPSDDRSPRMRGTVRDIVFTGEKLSIFVDTPCGRITASRQNRADGAWRDLARDRPVEISWRPLDMAIFPSDAARPR